MGCIGIVFYLDVHISIEGAGMQYFFIRDLNGNIPKCHPGFILSQFDASYLESFEGI